jgi:hypothetical protein
MGFYSPKIHCSFRHHLYTGSGAHNGKAAGGRSWPTTNVHLVPRLVMSGGLLPSPHTSSRVIRNKAYDQFYLIRFCIVCKLVPNTHRHLCRGQEWGRAILPLPLVASMVCGGTALFYIYLYWEQANKLISSSVKYAKSEPLLFFLSESSPESLHIIKCNLYYMNTCASYCLMLLQFLGSTLPTASHDLAPQWQSHFTVSTHLRGNTFRLNYKDLLINAVRESSRCLLENYV